MKQIRLHDSLTVIDDTLAHIIEAFPYFVLLINPSGDIIYANASAKQIMGEGSSVNIFSSTATYINEKVKQYMHICLDSGIRIESEEELDSQAVLFSIFPIFDDNKTVQALLVTARNIALRKGLEAEVADQELSWKKTFNAIDDGICLVDLHRRIIRYNSAMNKFTNKKSEELTGLPCCTVIHGKNELKEECSFNKMLKTNRRASMIYKKNDRTIIEYADPLHDQAGVITGAVHTFRDITEQVQAFDIAQRKDSALNELLSKVNHREQELKMNLTYSARELVFPILEMVEEKSGEHALCAIMRKNLSHLFSPYAKTIANPTLKLTLREIKICEMVRNGLSTKETAELAGTSPLTIQKQRKIIRKKLGITDKRISLAAYLQSLNLENIPE